MYYATCFAMMGHIVYLCSIFFLVCASMVKFFLNCLGYNSCDYTLWTVNLCHFFLCAYLKFFTELGNVPLWKTDSVHEDIVISTPTYAWAGRHDIHKTLISVFWLSTDLQENGIIWN